MVKVVFIVALHSIIVIIIIQQLIVFLFVISYLTQEETKQRESESLYIVTRSTSVSML